MKKQIVMLCAALALAGCSRQADNRATGNNDTGTSSGYNSSTTSNTTPSTNSSGGLGNSIETNSGAGSSSDGVATTTPK